MSIKHWSIRLGAPLRLVGRIDDTGLSLSPRKISGFPSREAAAAWILRYLDALIVDTAAELTSDSPTCFIEPSHDDNETCAQCGSDDIQFTPLQDHCADCGTVVPESGDYAEQGVVS